MCRRSPVALGTSNITSTISVADGIPGLMPISKLTQLSATYSICMWKMAGRRKRKTRVDKREVPLISGALEEGGSERGGSPHRDTCPEQD